MTGYNLIDSSVWINYFVNGNHKDLIETQEKLLLATISIIEIRKKLNKLKISNKEIIKKIDYIKKQSILISLGENVADKASEIVIEKRIPVADSVIYASALANNAILITLDNDFRNLKNVKVL
ncbi:PIN domain-containing protein [Candidatus Pacearchaeota archaeon]|nr:PIN domain-containing protein [Candidatus Pacearchaeota archaeon]